MTIQRVPSTGNHPFPNCHAPFMKKYSNYWIFFSNFYYKWWLVIDSDVKLSTERAHNATYCYAAASNLLKTFWQQNLTLNLLLHVKNGQVGHCNALFSSYKEDIWAACRLIIGTKGGLFIYLFIYYNFLIRCSDRFVSTSISFKVMKLRVRQTFQFPKVQNV